MHIAYTLEEGDIFTWNRHVADSRRKKHAKKARLVLGGGFAAMAVVMAVSVLAEAPSTELFISVVPIVFVIAIWLGLLLPPYIPAAVRIAIQRGRYREHLGPHMLMQTWQELVHVSERGEDRTPIWMIQRVLESPDLYFVVVDGGKEIWIAKRAFATQMQRERFMHRLIIAAGRHERYGDAVPPPPAVAHLSSVTARADGVPWECSGVYGLLLPELRQAWQEVQASAMGMPGEPPVRWYIQEHTACSDDLAYCTGAVERLWLYDGSLLLALPGGLPFTVDQNERGGYWADGVLMLHIRPDGRHVVWNMYMGRKHARGRVLRVTGQGRAAVLEQDPAYGSWSA